MKILIHYSFSKQKNKKIKKIIFKNFLGKIFLKFKKFSKDFVRLSLPVIMFNYFF